MKQYVESELVPVNGLKGEHMPGIEIKKEEEGWIQKAPRTQEKSTQTRQDILKQAKRIAESIYHPVGSCKMGNFRNPKVVENANSDDLSVVDPLLRVHGISNLRVADASIMPQITSGNTNAPSIMIGERCAELILNSDNHIETFGNR